MKKTLTIFLLFIFYTAYSQNDTLKPKAHQLGASFNMSGILSNFIIKPLSDEKETNFLYLEYILKKDKSLRFGFGVNDNNQSWFTADSVGASFVEWDSTYKQNNLHFSIGFEKHFEKLFRLDPYIGFSFTYSILGKQKINSNKNITEITGTEKYQYISTIDGGYLIRMDILLGFNYFVSKNLALGLEYNFGYFFSKEGGDENTSTLLTPVSGAQQSSFLSKTNIIKKYGMNFPSMAQLLISYYF